jgi:Ca2+/Na+ antiporter
MARDSAKMFEFMLKEYEMLYSKFEMHYNSVEKTIALYFLIVSAMVSANSFFIENKASFSIFNLSEIQYVCCLFIFIIGTITCLKIIEQRLLIITYVKNLNQNRKWFNKNVAENELQKFSLFQTSYTSPKYYKRYRHFYWEIMGVALINSSFIALFLINFFKQFNISSHHPYIINCIWLIIISVLGVYILFVYYKNRGETEEKSLEGRGLE